MKNKIEIADDKNNIVIKHRDMVTKLNYNFGVNSMRYLSALITQIHKDDNEFEEYSVTKHELEELLKVKINSDVLNVIAKELSNFKVESSIFIKSRTGETNIFEYVEYDNETHELISRFGRRAKPLLLDIKNQYLNYGIHNILPLPSTYLIRLYEYCKNELERQERGTLDKVTFDIEIQKIRELFVIPNSYQYAGIKERIIIKAQKEFLKHTDIAIEYKENKKGRKVISLTIEVTRTKEKPKKKINNFKPYLEFRDSLLNIEMLHEDYLWDDTTDGVYGFDLLDDYTAIIDTNKEKVYLGDVQGVYLDDRKLEELGVTVDEIWQEVFSRKSEIEEKFNY